MGSIFAKPKRTIYVKSAEHFSKKAIAVELKDEFTFSNLRIYTDFLLECQYDNVREYGYRVKNFFAPNEEYDASSGDLPFLIKRLRWRDVIPELYGIDESHPIYFSEKAIRDNTPYKVDLSWKDNISFGIPFQAQESSNK